MDGGVVRLILAAIAAVMILCVSVSGTDLTIVLLGGIALSPPAHLAGTTRTTTKTNDYEEGVAVSRVHVSLHRDDGTSERTPIAPSPERAEGVS